MGIDRRALTTALYVAGGAGEYVPGELTQGPWSPGHQFGGAPAALAAEVIEKVPALAPMRVARLTVDLLRPVPIAPIVVETAIRREGKQIQLIDASLYAAGVEVVRVSALRIRTSSLAHDGLDPGPTFAGPPAVPVWPGRRRAELAYQPGMGAAVEYAHQHADGLWVDPTWMRLKVAVIAGQPVSPLARMAYVADCASAYGHPLRAPLQGINADISLSVLRYGPSEWLCLTGDGWTAADGIGVARAVMTDGDGVVATVTTSRLVTDAA